MTTYTELLAQREDLDRQIEDAYRSEADEAIDGIRRLIAAYGLTAKECGFEPAASAKVTSIAPGESYRAPARVKYRGPNGETWTGRGRQPSWLGSLIEDGHSRQEYLAEKVAA